MVIVYGHVSVDPGRLDEVRAAAAEFQARCRSEDGCIDYTLSWDTGEAATLCLLEAWTGEPAHEVHREQEHVKEWTAFIASASLAAPVFKRHAFDGTA
ncbi:quinol monooxygenase YgiN [Thermocatellispora tengchongensis]|uniref:Quinol monooxygenase YgiN n=1 Tax=Thermocatellispora tengchongensis TaxID=1073253 RepID=A0A840P8S2_9ACTN|nr:putative quinol monooxygenase [Thermocatellispora tengchongensis]MBB5134251.1 quinol monooxygenase YgiN [Thermocatellispora tengchongensis]